MVTIVEWIPVLSVKIWNSLRCRSYVSPRTMNQRLILQRRAHDIRKAARSDPD